jgi:hypothetical protein
LFSEGFVRVVAAALRFILRGLTPFIVCTAAFAQTSSSASSLATITISVIDENGSPIDGCHVERFFDRNREMSSHFHDLQGTKIPYGVYQYAIKRPGALIEADLIRGLVSVWVPEKLVVVAASRFFRSGIIADSGTPSGFMIRGELQSMKAMSPSEPLWIRLIPVFGGEQLDVGVDSSGEFRIHQALSGRYLLIVIQGTKVLQSQQVSFEQGIRSAQLVIKVSDQPSSILHVQSKN